MKIQNIPSFADSVCDLRIRKIKSQFFNQVNLLLDWKSISKLIDKHYTKGKSAVGVPSYDGLLLFKMCLLQTWYGLSDYEVEDRINDSISFSSFCGLTLEQPSPDHSTLSRFRTAMTKVGAFEKLFKEINRPIITYKGYRNKKVNNFPTWLKVEVEGAVDLYYGFQTALNQPNRNMWYLKKQEDEIAYFIAVKYSGGLTMTAGHNNAFKKNTSIYLSNHKELSAKIEEGSYKLEDIKTVVDLYNSAKE